MSPQEAIDNTRNHIADSLNTLYFAQDNLDLSRPESQQLVDILSANIVNDIERINLVSKTLKTQVITADDEQNMQRINDDYNALNTDLEKLSQSSINERPQQSWVDRIVEQQNSAVQISR